MVMNAVLTVCSISHALTSKEDMVKFISTKGWAELKDDDGRIVCPGCITKHGVNEYGQLDF